MGRRMRGMICVAAMLAAAFPCARAQGDGGPQSSRLAPIGFAGPLADPLVTSARLGAQLAIEEANSRPVSSIHGLPPLRFELLAQDDKGNPNLAGYAARYFAASKAIGVLGHWNSGPALAAAPTYEEAGIAQLNITPTSSELSRQGFHSYFRLLGGTDDTAAYLAQSAASVLEAKRVAVIYNDTPFSVALAGALARNLAGRAIHVRKLDAVSAKTSDFNAPLKAAIDSGADLIFFSAITSQLQPFIENARRMNVRARILLTGGAITRQLDDSGRVYSLEPNVPDGHCPQQHNFRQRYVARYGSQPTLFSRDAYDAAGLLVQAARQVDSTDPAQVAGALHVSRYQGLGGEIRFDQQGNNAHPVYTLYRAGPAGWQPVQVLSADPGAQRCAGG